MPSERIQRRVDAILDQADEAVTARDWAAVREFAGAVLAIDAENEDAAAFLAMADGASVGTSGDDSSSTDGTGASTHGPAAGAVPETAAPSSPVPVAHAVPVPELPSSFAAGRYQVRRFVGEGGKKRVFLAHDMTLDRDVAFGQFRTEGLDAGARARVLREAQAMGRVGAHPNLVTIYDIGEDGGAPYIVQEFVPGGSVTELLHDGHPPLEQALAIARDVCAALAFIHEQRLIHRDIKPSNIFLADDGSAKVGDFGLAVGLDRTRITMQGGLIGTPSYMPPEQALSGDITPQSDLYSLGATLYELVTGQPPFSGDDATAVISQHINTPPVAPSWHSDACPPSLEALILQLLAKDPSRRPESAAAVQEALESIDPDERSARHTGSGENPLEGLARGVFVGREAELERLRTAFDEAFAARGSVVMLVGEPGIGKTRTTQELETYARMRGARVLWGRAHEASGAPAYWPWIQVGNNHARFVPPAEIGPDLDQSQIDELGRIFPALQAANPQPITDPAAAQFRLFDAYTAFLRAAAERAPLVIVLDDLHWADAPSLQLLQHLARELPRMRILVIGTFRDTDLTRTHPLSAALAELTREGHSQRVLLRGLSEAEVANYIRTVALHDVPRSVVARIYEETEGNPFFLSEVVNLMAQEGGFGTGAEVSIPDGVREAIGRRLNLLSEEANEMLTIAAVVGREFPYDTLALLHDGSGEELVGRINEGLRARVIDELEQPGRYQFTHAQMQETLLSEISTTSRVHLNARIADALERRYGDQAEARASRLARHFFEAATLSDEYAEKALRYSVLAARSAEAQSGWGEAARHYEHALTLVTNTPSGLGADEAGLLAAHGRCMLNTNVQRPAWRSLMRAITLYDERGDAVGMAAATLEATRVEAPRERRAGLIERAAGALGEREPLLKGRLYAELFRAIGGEGGGARLDVERGREIRARLAEIIERSPSEELDIYLVVMDHWLSGAPARSLARMWLDVHRRASAIGRSAIAASFGYWAVAGATGAGDFALALSAAGEAIPYAAGHGYRYEEENGAACLGLALLSRGEFAAFDERRAARPFDRQWLAVLTDVVRAEMTGQIERAVELLPDVASDVGPGMPLLPFSRARLYFIAGDEGRARRELARGIEGSPSAFELDGTGASPGEYVLSFLTALDEAFVLLEESQLAAIGRALLGDAINVRGYAIIPPVGRSRDRWAGDVLLKLGFVDEARKHYASALEWSANDGWTIEEGRTRQGLAELAAQEGDIARALAELDAAADLFQRCGAQLYLDRVIAKKLELQGAGASGSTTSLAVLTTNIERERPDVAPHAAPDGTVTILFSDIEGSTALNVELGDHGWMALLGEHNEIVRAAIAEHRGFEVKTEGDAFMVAFQSARDALRCAQEMQRALSARNAGAASAPAGIGADRALQIRIGLHTGEPVRDGDDFYGTHVVMAARIASLAQGGEILVSSLMRELVASSGEFTLDARPPVELKGLSGEHVTYAVGW